MRLDVTPPVDESVEKALRAALATVQGHARNVSAWRRAAMVEAVDREHEDGYAFSPRSTLGATRA